MTDTTKPIAACGLFCGACRKFAKGACPGCPANEKAAWCDIRRCCIDRGYATCAECAEHADPRECRKFNNFVGKVMGVLLNSDRFACVARIREVGVHAFAAEMEAKGLQTLPRR